MPEIKKRRWFVWIVVIKVLTLISVGAFIYFKINDPANFGDEFKKELTFLISSLDSLILISIVILLMPLNWILEAIKWKLLVKKKHTITIGEAMKGVLSGLTLGFVTPHALGDYAGRIFQLRNDKRGEMVGSVWLGKVLQMTVTSAFGLFGVLTFNKYGGVEFSLWRWLLITGVFVIFFIVLAMVALKVKNRLFKWVRFSFRIILSYTRDEIISLLLIAIIRYLVFSMQFILLLMALNIELPLHKLFAGVSWVFLFKSIIPSFNFMSDLGIRELSALTFFDVFNVSQSAIVTGSLLIWTINILFPVIVGSYFVIKMKITR